MTSDEIRRKRQSLHDLVKSYTRNFPPLYPGPLSEKGRAAKGAVVLVSGTTGAFGSNILAIFAQSPLVETVYAISRPTKSGPTVFERHSNALVREGFSADLLVGSKVRLIEGDLHLEEFGLQHELYETLVDTVTHIIHNGWQVNLNLPISEFGPNILSVRKLVDFCLQSRAHPGRAAKLIFISSFGVIRNADPSDPERWWMEESIAEPDCAFGSGYTEAKWVSEHILDEAARRTPLKPTAVRLGQIVGGPSGYWNEKEWWAALVKSSVFLGKLPAVPGALSWLRADDGAKALLDMLDSEVPYVHLCHPNPILELELAEIFSARLDVRVVHIDDWMDSLKREHDIALEIAGRDAPNDAKLQRELMRKHYRANPAARIMSFFRNQHDSSRGKPLKAGVATIWSPLADCEVAVRECKTLQALKKVQVGEAEVDLWISKWQEVGFLEKPVKSKANL